VIHDKKLASARSAFRSLCWQRAVEMSKISINGEYIVISVMGPHAGESEDEIFKRKIGDIEKIGQTFWLIKSYQAKPNIVQQICQRAKKESKTVYCIFIEAASNKGAIPTKEASFANSYSADGKTWNILPKGLSPVTGKIDGSAYALVFDQLELVHGKRIDLWNYADYFEQNHPIRILQGASTLCGIKKDMKSHKDRIKSNDRKIVAVGKLCDPFCVWLK
jgi:hypothetical protein